MKIDTKSMTRKELEKLKSDVEKALVKIGDKEKKAALAAAKKAAAAHGFSLDEITGAPAPAKVGRKKARAKKPSAPKYCNPDDKSQTWTGKGRQPQWFKEAIAAGTSPDALEV